VDIFIWGLAHKEKYMPRIVKGLQSPTHTEVRVFPVFVKIYTQDFMRYAEKV
jgi:hypothetical protein